LDLPDAVLATLLAVRFGARWEVGMMFRVSRDTVGRLRTRLEPILAASSAAHALVRLSIDERRERLLRAVRRLPDHGGVALVLGRKCGIWIDESGVVWPYDRVMGARTA
jgi:hypothetical protein